MSESLQSHQANEHRAKRLLHTTCMSLHNKRAVRGGGYAECRTCVVEDMRSAGHVCAVRGRGGTRRGMWVMCGIY
jgi:hypothetical protein